MARSCRLESAAAACGRGAVFGAAACRLLRSLSSSMARCNALRARLANKASRRRHPWRRFRCADCRRSYGNSAFRRSVVPASRPRHRRASRSAYAHRDRGAGVLARQRTKPAHVRVAGSSRCPGRSKCSHWPRWCWRQRLRLLGERPASKVNAWSRVTTRWGVGTPDVPSVMLPSQVALSPARVFAEFEEVRWPRGRAADGVNRRLSRTWARRHSATWCRRAPSRPAFRRVRAVRASSSAMRSGDCS